MPSVESSTSHNFRKTTLVLLKRKKKKKEKPKGETPALVAFENY